MSSAVAKIPRAHRGEVIVERLSPPAPGQYWRAIADIQGRHDTRGSYNGVDAGTVLMINKIEFADGQEHVIIMSSHPSREDRRQVDMRFHAEDFYRLWEYAPDGAAIRENEINALMLEMRATQDAMRQPPPDAQPAALLGHQPEPNQGGETGNELATREGLQAMVAHAEQLKDAANKQLAWIETHTKLISQQGSALARFHQERAAAMLAAANAKLEGLSGILSTVKNLKIYVGDGVKATLITDGAPAAPETPITLYQDLLAFDEELLLQLDNGGLDHRMVEDVASALADPAFANQMIPSERGLVMVRFRGSHKDFVKARAGANIAESIGVAMVNEKMNAESSRHRLLYRDGARFFMIECDEILPAIKQLLPNTAEQNGYFRRTRYDYKKGTYEAERITPDDIDYADAQKAQLTHLNDYARVLICLWGLHDRTDLFESTTIPRFSNWLDAGFQQAHLRLISHDSLLGEERPSYSDFRETNNSYLAAGVTVAVNLVKAFDADSAPTCFKYIKDGRYSMERAPTQRVALARVHADNGAYFVEVDTKRNDYSGSGRVLKARLWLLKAEPSSFLVLNRVQEGDARYYLTSRAARRHYADYVELFRAAVEYTHQRDMREAPWHDWLRTAIAAGGLRADERMIQRAILDALSVARSATRSGVLPECPASASKAMRESILNTTHAALTDHGALFEAVKAWSDAQGFTALMLRHGVGRSGRDEWAFYREAAAAERDPRIDPFPWVARQVIALSTTGEITAAPATFTLLRNVTSEQQAVTWAAGEDWLKTDHEAPCGMEHAEAIAALDWIGTSAAALEQTHLLARPLFDAAVAHNRKNRTRRVARLLVDFPIGSVIHRGQPMIMAIAIDAMRAAHLWGDAQCKRDVESWIDAAYQRPESHLEALTSPLIRMNDVTLYALSMANKRRRDAATPWIDTKGVSGTYFPREEKWALEAGQARKEKRRASLRLTSLTPFGAREFPWLLDYCERPTSRTGHEDAHEQP